MRPSLFIHAAAIVIATTLLAGATRADFIPIALTSDSFNEDIVVEKAAPPPIVPVTTASMDAGSTNTGFGWYEKGYHSLAPSTGLPPPGSIIQSDALPDNTYQFASDYKTNNAILVGPTLTNGTFTLAVPSKFARLSLLLASGNGSANLRLAIHHQDSTTETVTNTSPDWMTAPGEAFEASGRIDVQQFVFDSVFSTSPRLFARDVTLSNPGSAVTSVEFEYVGGAAHIAVFALSGSTNLLDAFTPLAVTGYNADLVVEASAARRQALTSATSASMETGTVNAGRTWYERNYYPPATNTGLPAAGSLVTNALAPDHVYVMPPSYTTANALMIDSLLDSGMLTPTAPAAYSALSFLCASSHGPLTNQCIVQYANGSTETNNLVVPDWFDNSPAAFIANGELNLNTRMTDSVGANYPKLYAVDLSLANAVSPVTNVLLTFNNGPSNSHSVIFALSGLPAQTSGVRPILAISRLSAGHLRISTTQPGVLQSTTDLKGTNTIWQNEGVVSSTLDISPPPGVSAKFYRMIGQ